MSGKLQPGMVVVNAPDAASSFDGKGVITAAREFGQDAIYVVRWSDGAQTEQPGVELARPSFHGTLRAGDEWLWPIDEVDMTSELMKVRVFEGEPGIWIDVRLFGLPRPTVEHAARCRKAWLETDRQKLDWFKPGQIVNGDGALARPATVIRQVNAFDVEVITSNGVATVPFDQLQLHSNSVQALQAKEAQKREEVLDRFRTEVRDKTLEAKEEHDLCDEGVKNFLTSLGIKAPVNKVRAVLHLTVEVDAVVMEGSGMTRLDLDRSLNRDWWGNTLKFEDDGKDLQFKDDDDIDMDSVEVRLISQRVEEVHDETYMEE